MNAKSDRVIWWNSYEIQSIFRADFSVHNERKKERFGYSWEKENMNIQKKKKIKDNAFIMIALIVVVVVLHIFQVAAKWYMHMYMGTSMMTFWKKWIDFLSLMKWQLLSMNNVIKCLVSIHCTWAIAKWIIPFFDFFGRRPTFGFRWRVYSGEKKNGRVHMTRSGIGGTYNLCYVIMLYVICTVYITATNVLLKKKRAHVEDNSQVSQPDVW